MTPEPTTESIFDKDLTTSFDNADLVAALYRIDTTLTHLGLTVAFGIGVLMYLAVKK